MIRLDVLRAAPMHRRLPVVLAIRPRKSSAHPTETPPASALYTTHVYTHTRQISPPANQANFSALYCPTPISMPKMSANRRAIFIGCWSTPRPRRRCMRASARREMTETGRLRSSALLEASARSSSSSSSSLSLVLFHRLLIRRTAASDRRIGTNSCADTAQFS